ncbi:uncharacterized protein DUF2470 [Murinocardiopsis flavida]|uniref:Uncharacterized protein DUF2470 n=1 Tax=Murinocardiopsis flavida TaxID=645275 RepID=A0A2P8DHY1_9ACTN|nr:DUF2470 domain-containing protein [Murinocardiopsis flavida]PSK96830.1 uncharacterized protein DUF2470 [Murinocardiopsis flavida]
MPAQPFSPEVVSAVTAHMNGDHPEDTLVICRAFGGRRDATAARMVGLDAEGGDYLVTADGAEEPLRVPWSYRLTERAEIRREVVRLYREGCAVLGLEPR